MSKKVWISENFWDQIPNQTQHLHTQLVTIMHTDLSLIDNYSFDCSGQMSGYYNPYAGSFSAAHMAAAAAAAAAQQSGQVSRVIFCLDIFCAHIFLSSYFLLFWQEM